MHNYHQWLTHMLCVNYIIKSLITITPSRCWMLWNASSEVSFTVVYQVLGYYVTSECASCGILWCRRTSLCRRRTNRVCCTLSMERTPHWSPRVSSDKVSWTFTYHTWQFIIFTIFTITACIFFYSLSISFWTQDMALQQILSSTDLFLFYRTDSMDSRKI